ncbi:class II aldolase/adducin family protein [Propionimicrobium sp. PCR01-08-3]|uniref:class II aldolase/adducin family protein n=1 Tax=Propionimicrobium sp. PCR01-08-3 TaxID=3052086 RepID=UPI00255CC393|nr:class II aldolase/adducin family protein [Propionimicrobium sp. PCR01-08-3]WIY82412.1 class II aldolase/adducin family protein [Propionimicrobium sp. PCR01-08-3]
MDEQSTREQICTIGRNLWLQRLVTANDGNVSVRLDETRVLCTPTGVSKGAMTPEMLTLVDLDGTRLDDKPVRPSSEVLMHLEVYRQDPNVGAVVHAHPMFATMWAVCGEGFEARMLPETIVSMAEVPLAPYATPSTPGVPESVRPFVRDHRACLLENHGALTWGTDVTSAYLLMERLEFTAELNWRLRQAGAGNNLPDGEVNKLIQLFS